jgi:inorganic pyrophosphatase/exopolyphosphatase
LSAVPPELKKMLLAAIGLDTDNWDEAKATEIDCKSTATLLPLSTLGSPSGDPVGDPAGDATPVTSTSEIKQALSEFTKRLIKEKNNVDGLCNRDLLRRDYKEFQTDSKIGSLRIGVPVFPRSVMEAVKRGSNGWQSFKETMDGFMTERKLDVLCVLTSLSNGSERNREILLLVKSRQDGAIKTFGEAKSVCKHIMNGLYSDGTLGMKAWKGESAASIEALSNGTEGLFGMVGEQGNLKPTRKYVMPLVVSSSESVC